MTEVFKNIFRNTGAMVSRRCADRSNTSCLAASLIGIGAELRVGNPVFNVKRFGRNIGETSEGMVLPSELLGVILRGADRLSMEVNEVVVNPSFLEHCHIPSGMEQVIRHATGTQQVARPHLRVMAKRVDHEWYTHAEADTGSPNSQRRIDELEKDGWISPMVVDFRRKYYS